LPAFWAEGAPGLARSGLNAALFHPTTGYSLPYAVRLADKIAASKDLSGPSLHTLTYTFAGEIWRKNNFFRLLNRMLFRAGRPEHRYRVLEHFYRLPKPLIERFYAGQLILTDKARLLIGKPPVPIREALGCLSERALLRRERGKP
jgi:lycopene beta-cyclase